MNDVVTWSICEFQRTHMTLFPLQATLAHTLQFIPPTPLRLRSMGELGRLGGAVGLESQL